ncbi:MAG: hypothetical protein M3O15_13770, partial [Acidobacteriota bacterium]|nr:hypothetical protein [Acidobacteriota bacterium]
RWAGRARHLLAAGGRLRLLGRALAKPFVAGPRRPDWQAENAALRRALAALGEVGKQDSSEEA